MQGNELQLTSYTHGADFLARTAASYQAREAENGLIYGLARVVAAEPNFYGSAPFFATVESAGELVVSALQTPPHKLVVHSVALPTEDPRVAPALQRLAAFCHVAGQSLPGVNGRVELTPLFADFWGSLTGARTTIERRMRSYKLTAVVWPKLPAGRFRTATAADFDQIVAWTLAFEAEALGATTPAETLYARARVQHGLDAGTYFVWDDGGPVSLAAATRATERTRTVSLVYTPPSARGRGYASATVASLSDHLLREGYQACTLFTDLANPTSNKIYQAIGYRPLCDFMDYRFTGAESGPQGT